MDAPRPDAGIEFVAAGALNEAEARSLAATLVRMEPWVTLGYGAEAMARGMRTLHPDLTRFRALRGGETQGLFVVRYPWLRGAYIELFAVLPGAQGCGVGRAAIEFIEATYRGRIANLWLLVSGFNAGARRFYERNGFHPIGLIPDLVTTGQDEILMRKVIPAGPAGVPVPLR
jgi:diamine N-acetyltransferase